jgi:hypothetical protein
MVGIRLLLQALTGIVIATIWSVGVGPAVACVALLELAFV